MQHFFCENNYLLSIPTWVEFNEKYSKILSNYSHYMHFSVKLQYNRLQKGLGAKISRNNNLVIFLQTGKNSIQVQSDNLICKYA